MPPIKLNYRPLSKEQHTYERAAKRYYAVMNAALEELSGDEDVMEQVAAYNDTESSDGTERYRIWLMLKRAVLDTERTRLAYLRAERAFFRWQKCQCVVVHGADSINAWYAEKYEIPPYEETILLPYLRRKVDK